MSERLENLRASMTAENADLVVLGPGAHLAWLLGVRPHADERPLLCCVTQKHVGFLMPSLEAESARVQTDVPFYNWADDDGPGNALAKLLKDFAISSDASIVLDETMRADFAALVQDALPGHTRQFTASTVGALRMRKDTSEYSALKSNALTADTAMQAAWAAMVPGMTELEVAAVAERSFADQSVSMEFGIIGAGANGSYPHHHTGNSQLARGQAVVMDIGGTRDGYFSDITRMAVIGVRPEKYDVIHAIVDAAVEAALSAARPGVSAKEVDNAARGVIEKAGYGEYFIHRTGHGLGTEVHEPPYITASSNTVLDEGMVFSIEPGIYLPGEFGIRLEEIVILQGDGPEVLSELPRDVTVIETA